MLSADCAIGTIRRFSMCLRFVWAAGRFKGGRFDDGLGTHRILFGRRLVLDRPVARAARAVDDRSVASIVVERIGSRTSAILGDGRGLGCPAPGSFKPCLGTIL